MYHAVVMVRSIAAYRRLLFMVVFGRFDLAALLRLPHLKFCFMVIIRVALLCLEVEAAAGVMLVALADVPPQALVGPVVVCCGRSTSREEGCFLVSCLLCLG